jgi:putative ATP-dependent endonuclease of OLD family
MLKKIHIHNYRIFQDFILEFNEDINILVGNNDTGKSTLLEAINLALTGRVRGQRLAQELSPRLIHRDATAAYVDAIARGENPTPPDLFIDLYLDTNDQTTTLQGTNNATREDSAGLRIIASFDYDFADEYAAFLASADSITLVPTEYYKVEWLGFSGNAVSARSIPADAALIDASSIRLQGGADYYLQQIISSSLDTSERVELARAYRSLREEFSGKDAIESINEKLSESHGAISDKKFSLSIDISSRTAWESSLVPHLDDFPIQYVGKGDQSVLKIMLALQRQIDSAHVLLIEEPENHLSPGSLNSLVNKIAAQCAGKQVFITTHSSYVLNKLGLEHLILIHDQTTLRLENLPEDTQLFFRRLSGFDTLRLVLASKVILVEGPSDDLIVQKAYRDLHDGKTPMEDCVDVIEARGLTFKRFLDIATPLKKPTVIVTDNDGKSSEDIAARYAAYTVESHITLCVGERDDGKTLEPQIVTSMGRDKLNEILGTSLASDDELREYMKEHKTDVALRIFERPEALKFPKYIVDAVS